jgi:hypothetical protein
MRNLFHIHPALLPYARREQGCFYGFALFSLVLLVTALLLNIHHDLRTILGILFTPLLIITIMALFIRHSQAWLYDATRLLESTTPRAMHMTTTCVGREGIGRPTTYTVYARLTADDGTLVLQHIPLISTDLWNDMTVSPLVDVPVAVYYDPANLRRPIVIRMGEAVYCMERRAMPADYPKVIVEQPLTVEVYPAPDTSVRDGQS